MENPPSLIAAGREIRVTGQARRPSHSDVGEAVRLLTARRPRRRATVSLHAPWMLVLAIILALGACSGDSEAKDAAATTTTGQAATTTTSTATTTTATTEDQKAAVLAAYRAYWADVVAAGRTADWQSPRLARHATGQALQKVRTHFRTMKAAGLIDLGTVKLSPKITVLRGRTAVVEDCIDVSRFLLHDAKTRQPRERPDPQPDDGVATLTLTADGWKVSKTVGRGKCAG
jgi:hypothetical protein